MLGVLGFACGFYSGVFFFSIICWCTNGKWNEVWGQYLLAGIFGVTGAIRGIQRGKLIVMIYSSIVGSYLFMRALTLFFPGDYPSEVELIHSQGQAALDMGPLFWLYLAIFLLVNGISLWYQQKYHQKDLDDEFYNYEDPQKQVEV